MVTRRMFSSDILCTDDFIKMSQTAQLLYCRLILEADDDGFVGSPLSVCRSIRSNSRSLDELVRNSYVHVFESGVAVVLHWLIHNKISPSKKKPTVFTEEAALLTTSPNQTYVFRSKISADKQKKSCIGEENTGEEKITEDKTGEEKREEAGAAEDAASAAAPLPSPAAPPPTKEEIEKYAHEEGLTHVDLNRFYSYYSATDWHTPTGSPIRWQSKLRDWDLEDRKRPSPKRSAPNHAASNHASPPRSSPRAAPAREKGSEHSFDVDDFFSAALARSYGDSFSQEDIQSWK